MSKTASLKQSGARDSFTGHDHSCHVAKSGGWGRACYCKGQDAHVWNEAEGCPSVPEGITPERMAEGSAAALAYNLANTRITSVRLERIVADDE